MSDQRVGTASQFLKIVDLGMLLTGAAEHGGSSGARRCPRER